MTSATQSATIDAPIESIRSTLLAAPQLPQWNPAFVKVDGPARAVNGTDYALHIIRGLHGTLTYTYVGERKISISWTVPLLAESGTWHLAPEGTPDRTRVTHTLERRGPLAAVLRHTVGTIPALRLERLAQRTAQSTRRQVSNDRQP